MLVRESCEFHDFLIYNVDSYYYHLKCCACKKTTSMTDSDLNRVISANVLDYSNIEFYKVTSSKCYYRNKNDVY